MLNYSGFFLGNLWQIHELCQCFWKQLSNCIYNQCLQLLRLHCPLYCVTINKKITKSMFCNCLFYFISAFLCRSVKHFYRPTEVLRSLCGTPHKLIQHGSFIVVAVTRWSYKDGSFSYCSVCGVVKYLQLNEGSVWQALCTPYQSLPCTPYQSQICSSETFSSHYHYSPDHQPYCIHFIFNVKDSSSRLHRQGWHYNRTFVHCSLFCPLEEYTCLQCGTL